MDERGVSWKILLSSRSEDKVLVCGLGAGEIAGLARTWPRLDWCKSDAVKAPLSNVPAELFAGIRFVVPSDFRSNCYDVVILGNNAYQPATIFSLLKANGVLVCVGFAGCKYLRKQLFAVGFSVIQQYGVLPAHKPRIIYPLGSRRLRRKGLGLHCPGSLRGRFGLGLIRLLNFTGVISPLSRGALTLAWRGRDMGNESLRRWLENQLQQEIVDLVIYCGSDSARRKLTLLGVGRKDEADLIIKVADSAIGKEAIQQETVALQVLTEERVSIKFPRVLLAQQWEGYFIQVQTSLEKSGHGQCQRLLNEHLRALASLAGVSHCNCRMVDTRDWQMLVEVLATTRETLPGKIAILAKEVESTFFSTVDVITTRVHGDFTPWNIDVTANILTVWDWEDSRGDGLIFMDIFHFIVRQAVLVGPWPGALAVVRRINVASQKFIYFAEWSPHIDYVPYLKIWLLQEYINKSDYRLLELAEFILAETGDGN